MKFSIGELYSIIFQTTAVFQFHVFIFGGSLTARTVGPPLFSVKALFQSSLMTEFYGIKSLTPAFVRIIHYVSDDSNLFSVRLKTILVKIFSKPGFC